MILSFSLFFVIISAGFSTIANCLTFPVTTVLLAITSFIYALPHPSQKAMVVFPPQSSNAPDRLRGILHRLGITDPVQFYNLGRRSQRCGFQRSVSVVLKRVAFSSPPKCGCDVNSTAEGMQVAKFTKYAGAFSVISVV